MIVRSRSLSQLRAALFVMFVCWGVVERVDAATITVNSNGDTIAADGVCTLREAITSANSNTATGGCTAGTAGADTIHFNITSGSAVTISPTTVLPTITEPLTINGFSQPGSSANSSASGNNAVMRIIISGLGCALPMGQNGATAFTIANTAPGSVIRGLVINGWSGSAVFIHANAVTVAGNFIGTNAAGTARSSNCTSFSGPGWAYGSINIMPFPMANNATANGNMIGGTTPADRNVISGSACAGVQISDNWPQTETGVEAANNVIAGNRFNTVAAGAGTSANNYGVLWATGGASIAVSLQRTKNTTVGGLTGTTPNGACTGACNVISGYGGINIGGVSAGTIVVQGNHIGIDANGVNALPPGTGFTTNGTGIYVSGGSSAPLTATVFVGGTDPQARNVISGWSTAGIEIQNGSTTCPPTCPATVNPGSLYVYGNYIGTNSAGTQSVPNGYYGINVYNGTNVFIGGTAPGAGNVISGNGKLQPAGWGEGIHLEGAFGCLVQGNKIGVAADGFSPLGNLRNGISFQSSGWASNENNVIGAAVSGQLGGNIIAHNGIADINAAGIGIGYGARNKILSNSIYSNVTEVEPSPGTTPTSTNIDLQKDGASANDHCDADPGYGNGLQNFPVITSAASDQGSTTIRGTFNSTASSTFTLEFFASPTSGLGDAQRFLGSGTVTTPGGCSTSFSITVPGRSYPGEYITATATSSTTGDTSEVSTASSLANVIGSLSGDFNQNGTADLLLRNRITGELAMWLLNAATIAGGGYVGSPGSTYSVVGVADFNADGRADVLLRDLAGNIGMWLLNGTTITTGALVGSPGGSYAVAATADFNGDGRADILLRDGLGNLGMWLMNGTVISSGAFVGSPGAYTVVAARDFNADGRADILLRDAIGNIGLWIMNGPTIISGHLVGSPGAYRVAGVGDFNGDLRSDILLQDSIGGLGMWFMNGATVSSGAAVGSIAGFVVAATGDYNNDGRADLLLKNTETGELGMYLMNGATISSGASVGSPGTVYQIH